MKKIILVALVFVVTTSYAQVTVNKITFEDCETPTTFQNVRNNTMTLEYVAANGAVLKIGDTLVIGTPSGSSTSSEVVGRGSVYSKTRSSFTDIIMGKPAGFGNFMNAMNGQSAANASAKMQGEDVVVSEMKVFHKGSRKKPLRLEVLLGEPNGRAFGLNKYMSVVDFEKAVLAGEIKSLHAPMTREEAIAKLKESKDLLDLGLMKPADYEKMKNKLAPIIMKK